VGLDNYLKTTSADGILADAGMKLCMRLLDVERSPIAQKTFERIPCLLIIGGGRDWRVSKRPCG
jgi:hypothetical protein